MKLDEAWPYLEALHNGKTLQVSNRGVWVDYSGDPMGIAIDMLNLPASEARIKPTPRTVPLGPADIDLHRDLFRHKNTLGPVSVAIFKGLITIGVGSSAWTWDELKNEMERSTDRGATWLPCSKEVE